MDRRRSWFVWFVGAAVALEWAGRLLGRGPTRAETAPGRALLVYDDGCEVCAAMAEFVHRHAREEVVLVGFGELPRGGILGRLDRREIAASAHFVTADGVEYHGGESVTRAARLLPGGGVVGILDWPGLRGMREIGYRLFAWRRAWVSRLMW